MSAELYDLVGVGLGPFNLSLAALAEPVPGLGCLFLDENPGFSWHPGMMVDGATLQVPFLADLVSLVDPTSRHGYLAWLREHERLFGFYFGESWHVPRIEYEAYCRDVAAGLGSCRFGCRVTAVRQARLADGRDGFVVCFDAADGTPRTVLAANVVLGLGTEPVVPAALRELCADGGALIAHSAHYLHRADWIRAADDVTVLGSGQSGAEIVLDLLRDWHRPGRRLRWLTRSGAFEPMEYSKIGLEHFTPEHTDYFHALAEPTRDQLLAGQGRLYKAVSAETLAEIRAELDRRTHPHGLDATGVTLLPGVEAVGGRVHEGEDDPAGLEIDLVHTRSRGSCTVTTERLVLATGYAPRQPTLLAPMEALVLRDSRGRPVIGRDHRVALTGTDAGLYVQNAELHTHGVGTPDLGLGAFRAAVILNAVAGREVYRLPRRTAHTSFTPAAAAAADPGIRPTPAAPGRPRHAQRPAADRPAAPQPSQPQIPSQPEDRRERRTRSTAHPLSGAVDVAGALRPAALRRGRQRAAGDGTDGGAGEPGARGADGLEPGAGDPGAPLGPADPADLADSGAAPAGVDDAAPASPDRG
ncbi:lysine N(6)-hydroxylase/L-ornithine N(5)-oxygenase family protein [Actinospica robiniae]|uniref:lysine N(6)-hydroxylase/L-ornithine N(5)-oxygenase family protein n=1 Tax=Actinospica robiniae TaxID=304901 RepID=UPI00040C424C|nr:SidA/IucD/PvdA family monooxygenase [Actinospica robiniae]